MKLANFPAVMMVITKPAWPGAADADRHVESRPKSLQFHVPFFHQS
jgi:hypothetical protein